MAHEEDTKAFQKMVAGSWHKLCGILMHKLAPHAKEIVLLPEDAQAIINAYKDDGGPCVLATTDGKEGIVLKIISMREARQLKRDDPFVVVTE